MAGNSIASGAATITASADQLAVGLANAKSKVEEFGKKTTNSLSASGKSGGRKFAEMLGADFAQEMGRRGFAGGVLGGLAGGGLAGGFSELIANSTTEVLKFLRNTEGVEAAAKRVRDQYEQIAKVAERNVKLAEEWRAAFSGRGAMTSSLDAEIDELRRERKELNALLTPGGGTAGFGFQEKFAAGLERGGFQRVKAIDSRITELEERLKRSLDPEQDPAFVGKVNKLTDALDQQLLTWGMTGTEAQRAMLVAEGATDRMLSRFDKTSAELKRLGELAKTPPPWMSMMLGAAGEAAHLTEPQDIPFLSSMFGMLEKTLPITTDLNNSFEKLAEHLRDSARFAGNTADEIAVMKLEERGLGAERAQQLRNMLPQRLPPWLGDALNIATEIAKTFDHVADKGTQFAGALEKGSQEAYSLIVRSQADAGGMETDKTAAAVKQLKTPLERAAERLDQINRKLAEIEDV